MSEVRRDFSNYVLGQDRVDELAGGLIPEIAEIVGVDIYRIPGPEGKSADAPTREGLQEFIATVGPDKEHQKNIGRVKELLGPNHVQITANWVERSGIMYPLERSFVTGQPLREKTDAIVFGGGVANWMLRRKGVTERFDPDKVGRVIIPVGNRVMGQGEHQFVTTHMRRHNGKAPTEADFAKAWILGGLVAAGFKDVTVHPVQSGDGNEVLGDLFAQNPELLDGTITVTANAPNGIQAAGQLRVVARNFRPDFDQNGDQVDVRSDSFALARRGEKPATNQNTGTALGPLGRSALFLDDNK